MKKKIFKALAWMLNNFTTSNVFFIYCMIVIFQCWHFGIDTKLIVQTVIICLLILTSSIVDIAGYCKKASALYEQQEIRQYKEFVQSVAKHGMDNAVKELMEKLKDKPAEFADFNGDKNLN